MTILTRMMLAIPLLSGLALGAAGGLDPSFGSGGKVITGFGHNARALDATLQSDGKLVVVLTLDNTPIATSAFAVARYLSNGTLDASFGRNGFGEDRVHELHQYSELGCYSAGREDCGGGRSTERGWFRR